MVAEPGDVDAPRRGVRGYKPTVLVLDLNILGGSSLEAIPAMTDSSPETAIVVVTMQEDPAFAREACAAHSVVPRCPVKWIPPMPRPRTTATIASDRPEKEPQMRQIERWLPLHLFVLTFVALAVTAALVVDGLRLGVVVGVALVVVLAVGYPLLVILAEGRDQPVRRRRA